MTKLNISMPQELLAEIDAEAGELGLTRSGLIQEAAARYIAGARGDREAERTRLRVESAASRMRAIGERCGLTGDAAQIVAEMRGRAAGAGRPATSQPLLAAEPVAQYGTAVVADVSPVRDLGEIAARIREHASEFAAHGVSRIGVFGSFAVGEQDSASDVDLLVEYAERPEGFAFFEAPALAERILGRKVDWTQPHLLIDRLEPRILTEVIYVWEA